MGEKSEREGNDKEEPEPGLYKPIDPRRVIKILEYRRKAANFVESMLEPNISIENLKSGEEFLCQSDYDDIVQERHLTKLCGYPLCSNQLVKEWKQKYHVSLRNKRIYDVEIRKLYCSVRCMDLSIRYKSENLPEQPIWMRPDDLMKEKTV